MPEPTPQRIVPGAPPPAPLSKTQKKKRKAKSKSAEPTPESPLAVPDATAAALIEKAPEPVEVQEGALAPELVAHPEPQTPLPDDDLLKLSPIVDLVQKRLKATTKKITRITTYAATDPEKLNDDQKRTLKTLPTLEAVQKELGEVKKAIEVHEAELAHELATKRAEAEKAEKVRIAEAVSGVEASLASKTADLLSLLRLHSSVATGAISISADDAETNAIFSVASTLIGEDSESKQAVISGFFSGAGDFNGISYARLLEVTNHALNPPPAPASAPEEEEPIDEQPEPSLATTEPEAPAVLASSSGGFHFMQESELETPSFEESAEWVEHPEVPQEHEAAPEAPVSSEAVNGHATEEPVTPSAPAADTSATIDWAAEDDEDLPPIAGLHAKFGTSGSATPAEDVPPAPVAAPAPAAEAAPPQDEDDGFTQARGGRGRGRGGFRGGERGGFRGGYRGERGGYRGGERGGYRGGDREHRGGERRGGDHEHRGGDREHRGGDREFRGGFRGGDRGGPRGGWRGDGERGRGRGRGRGDRGVPHTPTQA